MNESLSVRILSAVEGDAAAIRTLAQAIAKGDAGTIRATLRARGVELSDAEATGVLDLAHASAAGSACTCTCTCT